MFLSMYICTVMLYVHIGADQRFHMGLYIHMQVLAGWYHMQRNFDVRKI